MSNNLGVSGFYCRRGQRNHKVLVYIKGLRGFHNERWHAHKGQSSNANIFPHVQAWADINSSVPPTVHQISFGSEAGGLITCLSSMLPLIIVQTTQQLPIHPVPVKSPTADWAGEENTKWELSTMWILETYSWCGRVQVWFDCMAGGMNPLSEEGWRVKTTSFVEIQIKLSNFSVVVKNGKHPNLFGSLGKLDEGAAVNSQTTYTWRWSSDIK